MTLFYNENLLPSPLLPYPMKKLIVISLAALLTACVTTGVDLSNRNSYGLKCSPNATTQPNWAGCLETAKQMCAPQNVSHVQQLPPLGSGSPEDAYFMAFSCH